MRPSFVAVLVCSLFTLACGSPPPEPPRSEAPPAEPPPAPPPKFATARPVVDLAASADGKRLAALTEDALVLFDAESGAPLGSTPAAGKALVVAPDASWAAVGGADLVVYALPDGKERSRVPGVGVRDLAVNTDGSVLWAASNAGVMAYDPATATPGRALAAGPSGAVAANADRVLTGSDDGVVRLWDAASGEPLSTLEGHTVAVVAVALAADGLAAASSAEDPEGALRLWDLATKKQTTSFGSFSPMPVCAVAGPDFAAGSDEVLVYDVGRAALIYSMASAEFDDSSVAAVACAPGWIAAAGPAGTFLYVAATGERIP